MTDTLQEEDILEPTAGLRPTRLSQPSEKLYGASQPLFCVIAQGSREVYVGDNRYPCDAERSGCVCRKRDI